MFRSIFFFKFVLIDQLFYHYYQQQHTMIKRLKQTLFPPQIQSILNSASIDSSQNQIDFVELNVLTKKLSCDKDLKEITNYLQRYLISNNKVLRLKAFIACHYLLRKTKHEKLLYMLSQQTQKHKTTQQFNPTKIEEIKDFLQYYIIKPYQYYLNKLSTHFQVFEYNKNIQSSDALQLVNQGFQVINLITMILKTQESINKAGRYYFPKQRILLTLYVMYLKDLSSYNDFLKAASRKILLAALKCEDSQLIKHFYLFLNESQKASDLLYQYFHIRYFYKEIQDYIDFPTFLTINPEDFKQVRKQVKSVNKAFYQQVSQHSKSHQTQNKNRANAEKRSFTGDQTCQIILLNDENHIELGFSKKYSSVYNILQ